MTTAAITPDALSYVCGIVRDRSAIELEASKSYLIEARLMPLAKLNGYTTTNDFIQGVRVSRQPELERRLVEAMTTNETSFYRDIHPFTALRTKILPELCQLRASKRMLNIWSAACSTGQELYSIAMLIREHFPQLATWNVHLQGTDISEEVLGRARAGKFSQIEMNRGLPAPLMLKYFERDGMTWQVRPDLRACTKFTKLNFVEPWPTMPSMDVVFLRNVLIYFSPDTKREILRKVRQVMAPNAVLFLGAAETTMGLDAAFERIEADHSVFYRVK
ncbi:MAG: protein-glutamate O-methyltransferase CheR [Pirellulales bacterium]|nr:protein-glutamate O-methyltransferase CheR [Pirellulales bacterium]